MVVGLLSFPDEHSILTMTGDHFKNLIPGANYRLTGQGALAKMHKVRSYGAYNVLLRQDLTGFLFRVPACRASLNLAMRFDSGLRITGAPRWIR